MKVEVCSDAVAWDAYVQQAPSASNYHRWRWKWVIEETYGHPTYYLAAWSERTIHGVLPLVSIKSWLFGHFLVSLPFFTYGGVLASSLEAQDELLAKAVALARDLGGRHIELRQGTACDVPWQYASAKVSMIVPLPETADQLWEKLTSRLRNKIRNARKHGFGCRWGGIELVDSFYPVFATNMRNLGTPVYPRLWFENIFRLAADSSQILILEENARPVAATVVTTFRDCVEMPWIASLPEERKQYSTVLLYWTALEWSVRNGYKQVDLGRCTPGSGVYQFKRQWNCEERPLHWYYWLAPGVPVPHLRPDNPRFRSAVWLWRRLPLVVANWLGPRIVRSIP